LEGKDSGNGVQTILGHFRAFKRYVQMNTRDSKKCATLSIEVNLTHVLVFIYRKSPRTNQEMLPDRLDVEENKIAPRAS